MSYPTSFPVKELTDIIGYIKAGTVKENIKPFAEDLWWCQGYAQSVLIGQPPQVLSQESRQFTVEEAVSQLEQVLQQQSASEASAQALNPAMLLLLKFALEQLMQILKDYLEG